jgi:hypothetical protein
MADSKITALTALTAADPVNDMFPVVDVSDTSMAASGTTKRISANNILSSSPTASGALTVTGLVTAGSATITGNLTVDTNTLFVDSSNDRVLIGTLTALGSAKLSILGKTQADTAVAGDVIGNFNNTSATGYGLRIGGGSATGGYALSVNNNAGSEFHQISGTGIATWSNVGGGAGTAMTLNSTGLGVGKTASARLDVASARAASVVGCIVGTTGTGVVNDECQFLIKNVNTASGQNNGAGIGGLLEASASNKSSLMFYVDNGTAVTNVGRFDSNGNLILQSSATPATLTTNGQLTVNATSNTNLRFSYRGSDGTTRVANITLA